MDEDKRDSLPAALGDATVIKYDTGRLDRPRRTHSRANNAVHDVYDLIGGVPRMAIWADENPGEFYAKIWARTIQTQQQTEHSGEITIRTAVPRTAIDGDYTDVTDAASLPPAEEEGND